MEIKFNAKDTVRIPDGCKAIIKVGNYHYEHGNYFRTEEQAKEAIKRVEETLRKYHEEIGE